MGYETVNERLAGGGTVVLDGGVGTEVLRRTGRWVRNGIEDSDEAITEVHRDYLEAGCHVLTANTFQIGRQTFLDFFHDLEQMRAIGRPGLEHRAAELQQMAVGYARRAAGDSPVAVAGSISPLHHPFRSDLAPEPAEARAAHADTAAGLAAAGVDLLLLEGFNTLGEAAAALAAARQTGLPVWVSLIPDGHGRTLGGEPLGEAARLAEAGAAAVLLNCAPIAWIDRGLEVLAGAVEAPVGAYALVGRYAPPSWKMDFYPRFVGCDETPPEAYAEAAEGWIAAGARIVGGCCGTGPDHVRPLAALAANGGRPMSDNGSATRHRLGLLEGGAQVVLDGGIGTEILRRGTNWASHRIQDDPDLVRSIHADYVAAGADVITTNTFQLSQRSFRIHFNDDEHRRAIGAPDLEGRAARLIADAVRLAREARHAAGRPEVSIAGSMTTLEWCFRPDLTPDVEAMRDEYREMVSIYQAAGADLILFETFNKVAEARIALEAAAELGMPAWMGFVSDAGGRLLSGETMADVARGLAGLPCEAALVNCCPVDHTTAGLAALAPVWPGPTGAFAHVGKFYPPVWQFTDECPADAYLARAEEWAALGGQVLGGCCGTTPEYIRLLADRFHG